MQKVVFERERCKGCQLCVPVCPVKIIRMSERLNKAGYYPAEVPPDKVEECRSCGLCAVICPDLVIEVKKSRKKADETDKGGD